MFGRPSKRELLERIESLETRLRNAENGFRQEAEEVLNITLRTTRLHKSCTMDVKRVLNRVLDYLGVVIDADSGSEYRLIKEKTDAPQGR